MMDIEIYCDESNQQALGATDKTTNGSFFLIGGLWLPSSKRNEIKRHIREIQNVHDCFGEIKWRAVSPSKLPFYLNVVDYFFGQGLALRFRCIVIDTDIVNLERYHEADKELGYYKFCYQLLKNWIEDFNSYSIFMDLKTNRSRIRLSHLKKYLDDCNLLSEINTVQALPSQESMPIQLADFLVGATSTKFNKCASSQAKLEIIKRIEHHLKHPIMPTVKSIQKFNIFKIILA